MQTKMILKTKAVIMPKANDSRLKCHIGFPFRYVPDFLARQPVSTLQANPIRPVGRKFFVEVSISAMRA